MPATSWSTKIALGNEHQLKHCTVNYFSVMTEMVVTNNERKSTCFQGLRDKKMYMLAAWVGRTETWGKYTSIQSKK